MINEKLKDALSKSTCYKHPVGCAIHTVLSNEYILGWNGTPSRCVEHSECLRKGYASGEGMYLCPSIHAERRAIARAARDGIELFGGEIYMSEWFPCADCAKSIIESGLEMLVTPDELYLDKDKRVLIPKLQKQSYNFEMAEKLIREAGIEIIVDPSLKVK